MATDIRSGSPKRSQVEHIDSGGEIVQDQALVNLLGAFDPNVSASSTIANLQPLTGLDTQSTNPALLTVQDIQTGRPNASAAT